MVEPAPLPDGFCFEELAVVWEQRGLNEGGQHVMGAVSRKVPLIRKGKDRATAFRAKRHWMFDPVQMRKVLGVEFCRPIARPT